MSRYSGKYYKGASATVKKLKQAEAIERQAESVAREASYDGELDTE